MSNVDDLEASNIKVIAARAFHDQDLRARLDRFINSDSLASSSREEVGTFMQELTSI